MTYTICLPRLSLARRRNMEKDFLAVLESIRLLTAEQLVQLRGEVGGSDPAEPKRITELLVVRGWITSWQEEEIHAGRRQFIIGNYKLLDEVGKGISGKVYKSLHLPTGEMVALKVLDPAKSKDEESVARFRREAQLAASLDHPNIVAAFEVETEGDTYFWRSEYVQGRDLERWSQDEGALPIDWTCECIRQAALGLQHAHDQQLIHRDIKPSNLIVVCPDTSSRPLVKIIDLGVARMLSEAMDEEVRLTRQNQTLGTPHYMAPEQASDTRSADIRADIFSLGCTLYKLIAGQLPFPGKTGMQSLIARAKQDATPLQEVMPDAPPNLAAVLAKMLARNREDRYDKPADVADALAPFSK